MKRAEACSACKIRPVRSPKQRYCKVCHRESEKSRRQEIAEIVRNYRSAQRST